MTPSDKAGEVLRLSAEYLTARNVAEAKPSSEALLCRLLNCKRLELYVRFETRLSPPQLEAMRRGVKRLAAGEPVQYILGEVDFMGHAFKVDRRALIPRPETELLVEAAVKTDAIWAAEAPLVADVGTGSGCIAVSLALARPAARFVAVDLSADALALAEENARRLGVDDRIDFARDLADAADPDSLDAIVANLPYVSTGDWERLPPHIRNHEPRLALDGGRDGLAAISELIPDAWVTLKPGGRLLLEIGADQGDRVRTLLQEAGFGGIVVSKDLAGLDRIVSGARMEEG